MPGIDRLCRHVDGVPAAAAGAGARTMTCIPARERVLYEQPAVPLIGREVDGGIGDDAEDAGSVASVGQDARMKGSLKISIVNGVILKTQGDSIYLHRMLLTLKGQ